MPLAYLSGSSLRQIERPRCARCQVRMMLTRVQPGPAGADLLFECSKCEQVHKMTVQNSMKSEKASWIRTHLSPSGIVGVSSARSNTQARQRIFLAITVTLLVTLIGVFVFAAFTLLAAQFESATGLPGNYFVLYNADP